MCNIAVGGYSIVHFFVLANEPTTNECPGLEALLTLKPNVNLTGIDGKSPLVLAIEQRKIATAVKLVCCLTSCE